MSEKTHHLRPLPTSRIATLQPADHDNKAKLIAVGGILGAPDLGTRTAQVTFDDAVVSVDAILGATAAIGYESSVLTAGEDS